MIAGAIAFSAFLALLPFLAAVALVYGMVTPYERVIENIRELLFILPAAARGFIGDWLVDALTRREGRDVSLLIAVAIALVGALRAGRSIIAGLNTAVRRAPIAASSSCGYPELSNSCTFATAPAVSTKAHVTTRPPTPASFSAAGYAASTARPNS